MVVFYFYLSRQQVAEARKDNKANTSLVIKSTLMFASLLFLILAC